MIHSSDFFMLSDILNWITIMIPLIGLIPSTLSFGVFNILGKQERNICLLGWLANLSCRCVLKHICVSSMHVQQAGSKGASSTTKLWSVLIWTNLSYWFWENVHNLEFKCLKKDTTLKPSVTRTCASFRTVLSTQFHSTHAMLSRHFLTVLLARVVYLLIWLW